MLLRFNISLGLQSTSLVFKDALVGALMQHVLHIACAAEFVVVV